MPGAIWRLGCRTEKLTLSLVIFESWLLQKRGQGERSRVKESPNSLDQCS